MGKDGIGDRRNITTGAISLKRLRWHPDVNQLIQHDVGRVSMRH